MEDLVLGLRQAEQYFSIPTITAISLTLLILFFGREAYRTDFPKVPNIPEEPNWYPFVGHLGALGGRKKENDATVFSRWGKQLSSGIFQIRIGDQRAIIVGSWSAVKDIFITQNNSILDRPYQPGFHDKLGIDLSGSSITEQYKRCRSAALKALGKPMWPGYYKLIEPNSGSLIKSLYEKGQNGKIPIEFYPWLRQVIVDLALNLTYGARPGDFDDEFTKNLLDSLYAITEVRASTTAFRHYVPLLRLLPEGISKTMAAEKIRQKHIDKLYNQYLEKVAAGETPKCIVSSLGSDKLTLEEIHGTCISLLQAAPDTITSGVYQCCAWLCSEEGQPFQAEAYDAILQAYNGDIELAWNRAFEEENVPLIVSLYKETLRFFATSPFNNRRASKPINIYDTVIPKGMMVILNTQAVNHDPDYYPEATTFNPRRFLDNNAPIPHLSYGVGSRICPAYQISNRIMSAMLIRLILAFQMKQVEGTRLPSIDMIDFSDAYGLVALPRAYDCSFVARDETWLKTKLGA
ncbi:hypothetical protein BP5796_04323 [Coleophoma crateriformis]|uniref:Cytochrome P450 n=1 Tax=Coleophoma crateriformis TaxID=565419 RepID=A0A3D8SJP6_9HELO|nr:hypothetical protein BP5796_04323 [Coleophoma crateriformis]